MPLTDRIRAVLGRNLSPSQLNRVLFEARRIGESNPQLASVTAAGLPGVIYAALQEGAHQMVEAQGSARLERMREDDGVRAQKRYLSQHQIATQLAIRRERRASWQLRFGQ